MLLRDVSDRFRVIVGSALSSTRGDGLRPVKVLREVLGTANDLAGRPFCSAEELSRRRARGAAATAGEGAVRNEPAPVMVYFDGKDHRTKKKVEELLAGRDIPFKVLDVTDDEATRMWAAQAAKREEFPLVFIAGEPIGGLHDLTQIDVNGQLKKRVWG